MNRLTPRLPTKRLIHADGVIPKYLASIPNSLANLTTFDGVTKRETELDGREQELLQIRCNSLASSYEGLGGFYYGVGKDLQAVHDAFSLATKYNLKVFRIAQLMLADPDMRPGPLVAKRNRPQGSRDWSNTASNCNIDDIYKALLANNVEAARELAQYVGHVPCEIEDGWNPKHYVYLAHALRHAFERDGAATRDELKRIRVLPKDFFWTGQMDMYSGLAAPDKDLFIQGLEKYMSNHNRNVHRPDRVTTTEYFICQPATALAILALHWNIVTRDDLPADEVYLPLDLANCTGTPDSLGEA